MAGMKSALELAMEKLNAKTTSDDTVAPLSDVQRQDIGELRKQYDAKIAEKEIMLQADIRQLMQRRPPQEAVAGAHELREKFQQTKKALQEEMEAKITAVRTRA